MIVHFLQLQIEIKLPINIGESNLGRLFYEFLFFYSRTAGSNYLVYACPPGQTRNDVDLKQPYYVTKFLINTGWL